MAKMRGWLRGQGPREVTRNSNSTMAAQLGTWHGRAQLVMDNDGQARLTVENDKHGPREVWAGNVERAVDPAGQPVVRRTELENEYLVVASYMRGEGRWLARILMKDAPAAEAYADMEGLAIARAWASLFRDEFSVAVIPDQLRAAVPRSQADALRVPCPTCGAAAGDPCVPASVKIHGGRIAAYGEGR